MGHAFTFLLIASLAVGVWSRQIYNVMDEGATGDGITDDAQVFMKTWNATCMDSTNPIFLVPSGHTFLVDQLYFQGPCMSYIIVQVDGTIMSPAQIRAVRDNHWIKFISIDRLTIKGTGYIDGQGAIWYDCRAKQNCVNGPTAFVVRNCTRVHLSGLTFKNSPMIHISIQKSFMVVVSGINITAPGDSPNTDGIHIERSKHLQILNSTIGTGDDCISIETFTVDVNISHVTCGPGHGISIGSLGEGDSEAQVKSIRVSNCQFNGTTNGVRIKTCQGGFGYVKGVLFEHINFTSVQNPIIIDQYYGAGPNRTETVQVSDVRYVDVAGTSATYEAIVIKCSQSKACTDIVMDNVVLQSADPVKNITAICFNAYGTKMGQIEPALSCLTV